MAFLTSEWPEFFGKIYEAEIRSKKNVDSPKPFHQWNPNGNKNCFVSFLGHPCHLWSTDFFFYKLLLSLVCNL